MNQFKKPPSKSQTLRFVLYERWKRECNPQKMTFDHFYAQQMEAIINKEKCKI